MDKRRTVRRAALLLVIGYALGHLPGSPSGAHGAPPSPLTQPAPPHHGRPPHSCEAKALPRSAPANSAAETAARAVLACLKDAVDQHAPSRRGATLRADALTVTGLYCGPKGDGGCRARRVTLDGAHVGYPGRSGEPGSCTHARHITLTGDVRLRADLISGRAFGLLPLSLSTATVPPVPFPYLHLTDVSAAGLWSRARHATTQGARITPGGTGHDGCRH
ncbi:hypothetical protein [Streptomyces iconiensis]|uniref:Uncharacterized protein n=1 Tax=Streptomyces iconiensis TaxID=1384038 RepID=A0ABT6ZYW0_9ACTN|nr:hypothetical protein [Streptomyces iconiensis]MDJ1134258.1 hypothetical protein [Streptomyces iconiensis]